VTLSLNEIEALAKKATRGAGYPWGIAEEAGKAVRWLCAANTDGCLALAELLTECDGTVLSDRAPLPGKTWTSRGDRLCPLLAGAALSDLAETLVESELRLANVSRPILLAPFAGLSARFLEASVLLDWDSAQVATDGEILAIRGDIRSACADVSVSVGTGFHQAETLPKQSRAAPDANTLATLNRLAHRTFAPATEASRLAGAGAGLSDND
jgi:hypothetical protein